MNGLSFDTLQCQSATYLVAPKPTMFDSAINQIGSVEALPARSKHAGDDSSWQTPRAAENGFSLALIASSAVSSICLAPTRFPGPWNAPASHASLPTRSGGGLRPRSAGLAGEMLSSCFSSNLVSNACNNVFLDEVSEAVRWC